MVQRGPYWVDNLELVEPATRGQVRFSFRYGSERERIDVLSVRLTTSLATVEAVVSAAGAGMNDAAGRGALELDLGLLPAGSATLVLTPFVRGRRSGAGASVEIEVPLGEAGAPPDLLELQPLLDRVRRPKHEGDTVAGGVAVAARAGGNPLVSVQIRVTAPDATVSSLLVAAPSEGEAEVEVLPALFRSTDALGPYELVAVAIDSAGAVSGERSAVIELIDDPGAAGGPSIDNIAPAKAAAGETVVVRGDGFDVPGLEASVAGVAAAIASHEPGSLTLVMPSVPVPGPVVVRTAAGTAVSETELVPRVAVTVMPQRFEVAEGGSVQLCAVVTGTDDERVTWTVPADFGEIDSTGRFTAAFTGATKPFGVTATSVADETASSTARGRLGPVAGAVPGSAMIGLLGGTVRSEDGGITVEIPRRALAQPTVIAVRRGGNAADAGPDVAAEIEFEPAGTTFRAPVKVSIPLSVSLEPGSRLPVRGRPGPGDDWADLDIDGIVRPDGLGFDVSLRALPTGLRALKPFPMHPQFQQLPVPTISGVAGPTIEEGATAPVLVSGSNFVPGFTGVTVVDGAGNVDVRIEVRGVAVTADGTRLGTTVKVGVLRDLAEGATRQYSIRVTTPAGSASHPLAVLGHDELEVTTGTKTLTTSQRFSMMDVASGARLVIANALPPLLIEVVERASVRSRFTQGGLVSVPAVTGGFGTRGDGTRNGGPGGAGTGQAGVAAGGAGGQGGFGSGSAGAAGALGGSSLSAGLGGAGGLGGAAGGGAFSTAGGGRDGSAGRRFPSPGLLPFVLDVGGAGGGGGGGGGQGWVFKDGGGGGGGGGGAGGGAFTLAAGEELDLSGDVFALGGDGGNGALASTDFAGDGGGGAGGGGGALLLQGVRFPSGLVLALGGRNGTHPAHALTVNTDTPLQSIMKQPASGTIRVDGHLTATQPPAIVGPDLEYRHDLVSLSPNAQIHGFHATQVRVRDRLGNERTVTPSTTMPDGSFVADVTLFELFNDVQAEMTIDAAIMMVSAPIRRRTILFLPGTVPVYSFSCTIAPNPVTVPTERTVDLSLTVSATQPSPIAWSAVGSADAGTVGAVGQGARYQAPSSPPSQPVTVRASSMLVSQFACATQVNVIAGVTVTATAQVGTPSDPTIPSANVGQTITASIPPAVLAMTHQGFAAGDAVLFQTVQPAAPGGQCTKGSVSVQGTVAPGQASLGVDVPPCADADQMVRVRGHGSARLLVVPLISALDLDPILAPTMLIKGSGFICGATEIDFDGVPVPASQVFSVTCVLIQLSVRPMPGQTVQVKTAGGTSNGLVV